MIERYEQILPSSADRLLNVAEKKQSHRSEYDDAVLRGQTSIKKRDQ